MNINIDEIVIVAEWLLWHEGWSSAGSLLVTRMSQGMLLISEP